jgi:hypothetical protein
MLTIFRAHTVMDSPSRARYGIINGGIDLFLNGIVTSPSTSHTDLQMQKSRWKTPSAL